MVKLSSNLLYAIIASIVAILGGGFSVGLWIGKLTKRIEEIQRASKSSASVLKMIVDALIKTREKMLSSERVTPVDFVNAFGEATKPVSEGLIKEYFENVGGKIKQS